MPGVNSNMNVPPDPEIVARAWALSKTSITDVVGTRIATRLPQGATMPLNSFLQLVCSCFQK